MDISELQKHLNVEFHDEDLLLQAFTHSSYVNEHKESDYKDNERLEFLGDAVLELAVSEYLYSTYKTMPEGDLTRLRAAIVCEPSLDRFAKELDFGKYLLLGRGEEQSGGRERPAILADVCEAFLGALYLDQGFQKVVAFLATHVFPKIRTGEFSEGSDYKTQLQEMVQQDKHHRVSYEVIDETGPSHDKKFLVRVLINGKDFGEGVGRSKKEAEQRAAKVAIEKWNSERKPKDAD